jgi:hypothetical protein
VVTETKNGLTSIFASHLISYILYLLSYILYVIWYIYYIYIYILIGIWTLTWAILNRRRAKGGEEMHVKFVWMLIGLLMMLAIILPMHLIGSIGMNIEAVDQSINGVFVGPADTFSGNVSRVSEPTSILCAVRVAFVRALPLPQSIYMLHNHTNSSSENVDLSTATNSNSNRTGEEWDILVSNLDGIDWSRLVSNVSDKYTFHNISTMRIGSSCSSTLGTWNVTVIANYNISQYQIVGNYTPIDRPQEFIYFYTEFMDNAFSTETRAYPGMLSNLISSHPIVRILSKNLTNML